MCFGVEFYTCNHLLLFFFTKAIHHLKFTIGAHTTEESKREQQTRHRQGIDTSIKVERDD